MDKEAKAAILLRDLLKPKGDIFFYATVKEITGDTCTVTVNGFDLTNVRLKATDDGGQDKLVITPAAGSNVFVGANNGSLTDLFIVKADDPEVILWKHGNIEVMIDAESRMITIKDKVEITIETGTGLISIKNDKSSLSDLFTSIHDIIEQLTVSTPSGPSGTPLPPTIASLTQFKTDLNNLLK
jgi:hypothetical protein